jgi:hypothetical protein
MSSTAGFTSVADGGRGAVYKMRELQLQPETVRELSNKHLTEVGGGLIQTGAPSWCNYCQH